MSSILNNPVTVGAILGAIILLFIFQVLVLLRIKNILQQISFYIESISRFFYRVGVTSAVKQKQTEMPKTCQFCKNRLSFIHMSENKGEIEDFYYKCQLRNIEVNLDDTCEQYEKDKIF